MKRWKANRNARTRHSASSDVIDLHVDTFIWARVFGYDVTERHGRGAFGARFYGQADLPRLK